MKDFLVPVLEPSVPDSKGPDSTGQRTAAELDELREAVLDDWFRVTSSVTDGVQAMQKTLSWRVTRPLRLARILQKKVDEIGVIPASQLAAVAVAKRLGR